MQDHLPTIPHPCTYSILLVIEMCLTIRSYMNYIKCVLTFMEVFVCSACRLQRELETSKVRDMS